MRYLNFIKDYGLRALESEGIVVSDESTAELIISATLKRMLPLMLKHGTRKKYLLWTNEPRVDRHFTSVVHYPLLPKLHILNVYTGIFTHNYYWVPKDVNLLPITNFEFNHRRVVALMKYRNNRRKWSLKHQRRELDLSYLRTQIALEGHRMGVVDVYGPDWPLEIRKGESRRRNWRNNKLKILQGYNFNLAFENTNWEYYCTEKIWDAIQGGCLPIYYGQGNAIYEDFPEGSFLDYCDFGSPAELFAYIEAMTTQEFIKRMNLCIETFNTAVEKQKATEEFRLKLTVKRIQEVVGEG
ncbi:MAG: hypothetical protein EBE86_001115 [Hormoscilla sp. GUM202]|nr:hypothetical protein [Hormoscilla sp. GUM202]